MTVTHFGGVDDTKKWNMAQNMVKEGLSLQIRDT